MGKKFKERRSETRTAVSYAAFIAAGNMTASCFVANVSSHGAYLKMDEIGFRHEWVAGETVTVTFPPGTSVPNGATGRVLRREEAGEECCLAIYFPGTVTFL